MSGHILCAVDLTHTEDAKALLSEASRLGELQEAQLGVVNVLPDYGNSFVGSFFREGTLDEAARAAQNALQSLVDEVPSKVDHVQCIVEIGTVYDELLQAARRCNADLIVVGAHKPDLADRIIGPTMQPGSHATPMFPCWLQEFRNECPGDRSGS